MQKQHRLED